MRVCMRLLPFLLIAFGVIDACTGIRMSANDGTSVNGRTLEFGTMVEAYPCIIPRGYSFVGKTPNGDGLHYISKYATIGVYCFSEEVVMDGMNEKGLSCGAFYFPGFASYTSIDETNQNKALSPIEFPNWILTQFATLDEVKRALSFIAIAPTIIHEWGDEPAPLHYVVYDKKGDSLVIEPLEGKLICYDNPIGVFTNSPTFDWHMTNLRNYIRLSPFNANPITLRSVSLASFGQGSGLLGLPGDFTPPSRFVRAAIFSSTATLVETGNELVHQTFHILNQFDIPKGIVLQKEKKQITSDYTLFTSVKDPNTLRYYFKSYDDPSLKFIALKDFDLNAKKIKSMAAIGKEIPVNISKSLR